MNRKQLLDRAARHSNREPLDIDGARERVRARLIAAGALVESRRQDPPRWLRVAGVVLVGYVVLCVALWTFFGVGQ